VTAPTGLSGPVTGELRGTGVACSHTHYRPARPRAGARRATGTAGHRRRMRAAMSFLLSWSPAEDCRVNAGLRRRCRLPPPRAVSGILGRGAGTSWRRRVDRLEGLPGQSPAFTRQWSLPLQRRGSRVCAQNPLFPSRPSATFRPIHSCTQLPD